MTKEEAPPFLWINSASPYCARGSSNQTETATNIPHKIPHKLTRKRGAMTRKRKRLNSIVEIGSGIAVVRIYTINRRDGHSCILCRGGAF